MAVIIRTIICLLLLPAISYGAIFIDNKASGCFNGAKDYDPRTRLCGAGSDTVYTTFRNLHKLIPAGKRGRPVVINIRAGKDYKQLVDIRTPWSIWQKYSRDRKRPVFNGEWKLRHKKYWNGFIDIMADGVTIDGLEIKNFGHHPKSQPPGTNDDIEHGINIKSHRKNITVKNCYIHHIGGMGVIGSGTENVTVKNNRFFECQYGYLVGTRKTWGSAVMFSFDHRNTIISNNVIHGIGGEGLNLNRRGSHLLIEGNQVYDTKKPAIFINGLRNVVCRRNIVYHTGNKRYLGYSAGILVAAEHWYHKDHRFWDSDGVDVYENMVVNSPKPLGISDAWTIYGYKVLNTRFYNNTVIDPMKNGAPFYVGSKMSAKGNVVKNNIFWNSSSGPMATIRDSSGIDFANNLWSRKPPKVVQSSDDPTFRNNYPTLRLSKYFRRTRWSKIRPGDLSDKDFLLLPSAAYAIDTGVADRNFLRYKIPYSNKVDLGANQLSSRTSNRAPVARILSPSGPQIIDIDDTISFSGRITDPNGDYVNGYWEFDGGADAISCSQTSSPLTCNAEDVQFSTQGRFNVTLRGEDAAGLSSRIVSIPVVVGTPSSDDAVHIYDFESGDVTHDTGSGNDPLINHGAVRTGGGEPDPPGYGHTGAQLNGRNQLLSLPSAAIGNSCLGGRDTTGTWFVAFQADRLSGIQYLFSISNDEREKIAIKLEKQVPALHWGYRNGARFKSIEMSEAVSVGDNFVIGLSLDARSKTYRMLLYDLDNQTYLSELTDKDAPLPGSWNPAAVDLAIGSRSDRKRHFAGTVWFVRGYDEALSAEQMEAIIENR